jgi:hypothetical protein
MPGEGLTSRQHDAIVRAIKRKSIPPQNTALGGDIYIHGNGPAAIGHGAALHWKMQI